MKLRVITLLALLVAAFQLQAREVISLNDSWISICRPEGRADSIVARHVVLPHNWNDYYGYRPGVKQADLFGSCRYERTFSVSTPNNESVLLRLEGAGSYLTVYVNGQEVCKHQPAGMIVTTLDITPYLIAERNRLTIICDHPSQAQDLPWVSDPAAGFGVTNMPFGLFRNVSLEVASAVRITPFGVHAWTNESLDTLFVETEVRNYSNHPAECRLNTAFESLMAHKSFMLGAQLTETILQKFAIKKFNLERWTLEKQKTYKVISQVMLGFQQVLADRVDTEVGINRIKWPSRKADGTLSDPLPRFFLNDQPVWINGTSEVEHNFGNGYAFTDEECARRIRVAKYMGFNLFSDFSAPHNLAYQQAIEAEGMLWYPQFSARVWHDTPEFRSNFKKLLTQWVKERRNSPAIILWGLQFENVMPADFVRECRDLIRQLDPRASRLVTTSSAKVPASKGADWHLAADDPLLPTYGFSRVAGDPASEMKFCEQLHDEMLRSWKNRYNTCGHIQDALFSYPTPGQPMVREQARDIDQVGPFSDHGIFTSFWEPTDAYYLYVAWGDFLHHMSTTNNATPDPGKTARQMVAYGYEADNIPLPDYLQDLETDPVKRSFAKASSLLLGEPSRTYLYRINCGGDEVTDSNGHIWMGDDSRFSYNWSQAPQFANDHLSPFLASQAVVPGLAMLPVENVKAKADYAAKEDQDLLRNYRWGRQDLKYTFIVPPGKVYQVDAYFVNTRHFVHRVSYKTRVAKDGKLVVNFKNIKIGQQKLSALSVSMDRLDASDFGDTDRRGNFTFNAATVDMLSKLSPSHFKSKGYPYSEGKTWKEISK